MLHFGVAQYPPSRSTVAEPSRSKEFKLKKTGKIMSEKKYSYLSVLKKINKELDSQQENACCRTINSIVAAGAGSGKTQVLATRFAWLLMEDENLHASNILTLTYTKKAAAEMYGRIYKTLKLFQSSSEVPEFQRKNAALALKEFSSVHIQTLDSYCTNLLKQCANRYGISPDFSSGTSDSESIVKNLALNFVLKNLQNPAINYYCDEVDVQNFAEKIFSSCIINYTSLASPKNYFSSFIPKQINSVCEEWNKTVGGNENQNVFFVIDSIREILESPQNKTKVLSNQKFTDFLKFSENLNLNEISPEDFEEEKIETLSQIAEEFLQKISVLPECKNFKLSLQDKDLLKELYKTLEELSTKFTSLCSFVKDFKYFKELCNLLDEFTFEVNEQKRSTGNLTFKDVSELALKILIEQKDIRSQEKSAYKKIMIDEFQDNNGKNRDLLFLLSEKDEVFTEYFDYEKNPEGLHQVLKNNLCPEKLFFVGDEKQSIYKFRGAEVDVFNNLKNILKEISGEKSYCHMVYNYRSCKELLSSFNILFGAMDNNKNLIQGRSGIFNNTNLPSFEASYNLNSFASYVDQNHQEMKAEKLNSQNVKAHAAVLMIDSEFNEAKKNNEIPENELELEAYYLAKKIFELHKKNVSYSQIAILDSSRSKRSYFTRALERFNIPYKLDQQSKLFSDGIVNDIYNFLRLCVYPSDINSFSSYICSPLCGLSVEDLQIILSSMDYWKNPKNEFYAFDESSDEKICAALSKDKIALERYLNAKEFYLKNKSIVLSQTISQTLNLLWYDCGYRYETLVNSNVNSFEEHYDLLFELACQCDSQKKSLSWFIDELALLKESEKKIFSSDDGEIDLKEIDFPVESKNAVQFMTIHKSKGLQFDYVFILGCLGGKESKSSKLFFDEQFGLSLTSSKGSNYFYLKQSELNLAKDVAEYRRLIYVGITRAIKEFTVIGSQKYKKDGSFSEDKNSLLKDIIFEYYDLSPANKENLKKGISYTEDAPFDFELIPLVSKNQIYKNTEISLDEQKNNLMKKIQEKYSVLEKNQIELKVSEIQKISPSDFEKLSDEKNFAVLTEDKNSSDKIFTEQKSSVLTEDKNSTDKISAPQKIISESAKNQISKNKNFDFSNEIDSFMNKTLKNKTFSWNEFGTFVHLYLEYFVQGLDFKIIENLVSSKIKDLSPNLQEKLFALCQKICNNFKENPLGKKALNSNPQTEFSFKMYLDDFLINGSIDLFFKDENGIYTIIDYKTDHNETPEKYFGQQTCYKEALSSLYKIPKDKIKVFLYYVRFSDFVDITNESNLVLDSKMFKKIMDNANQENS